MKFYDAHIHFFPQSSTPDDIRRIFAFLEGIGLAGFDALVFTEYPDEIATVLRMVPGAYHKHFTPNNLYNGMNPFTPLNQSSALQIIPYLETRFIERDIKQKIKMYRDIGVKGIKVLYVPEEDDVYKIAGMREAFGRTVKQSERITSLLIDSASSHGMTVLFHVDLRRYGEFVEEMIKSYPMTNFNIPHLGFSRKSISDLLDKYPNCYTDISGLTSFMKMGSISYLNFFKSYQSRILFGSDAMIDQPMDVRSNVQFIIDFLHDQELAEKLLCNNYLVFHKHKKDG